MFFMFNIKYPQFFVYFYNKINKNLKKKLTIKILVLDSEIIQGVEFFFIY